MTVFYYHQYYSILCNLFGLLLLIIFYGVQLRILDMGNDVLWIYFLFSSAYWKYLYSTIPNILFPSSSSLILCFCASPATTLYIYCLFLFFFIEYCFLVPYICSSSLFLISVFINAIQFNSSKLIILYSMSYLHHSTFQYSPK